MTTPFDWLTKETELTERFYNEAREREIRHNYQIDDTLERKYWEGYKDATINALAAIYGPTPLEREEEN